MKKHLAACLRQFANRLDPEPKARFVVVNPAMNGCTTATTLTWAYLDGSR